MHECERGSGTKMFTKRLQKKNHTQWMHGFVYVKISPEDMEWVHAFVCTRESERTIFTFTFSIHFKF